jgi:hypothetical protein
MIAIESPLQIVSQADAQDEFANRANKPLDCYIELEFVFPDVLYAQDSNLNDREVLKLAENAGSFAFLDSSEEDIYNDLIKKPQA